MEKKIDKKGRVLCVKCNKPINIKDFGAVTKEGIWHGKCWLESEKKKIDLELKKRNEMFNWFVKVYFKDKLIKNENDSKRI